MDIQVAGERDRHLCQIPPPQILLRQIPLSLVQVFSLQLASSDRKNSYCGPYPTWSTFPPELRQQLWDRFQRQFSWRDDETFTVRDAWEKANTRRITQTLNVARKVALKSAGTDRISQARGYEPHWMNEAMWEGLILHWSRDEWVATSQQSSRNRQTQKEGNITKHTGGSISFGTHRQRLESELQRTPTEIELFDRTHKKKGMTEYVDDRARVAIERYHKELIQKYEAERALQEQFDRDVWLHAIGGKTKGKTYGFGGRTEEWSSTSSGVGSVHSTGRSGQTSSIYSKKEVDDLIDQCLKEFAEQLARRGGGTSSNPEPQPDDDNDVDDDDDDDDE